MYSVYFKKTERSDSTIRQSTFDIRHSLSYEVSEQHQGIQLDNGVKLIGLFFISDVHSVFTLDYR
jgi:hypothetical protein